MATTLRQHINQLINRAREASDLAEEIHKKAPILISQGELQIFANADRTATNLWKWSQTNDKVDKLDSVREPDPMSRPLASTNDSLLKGSVLYTSNRKAKTKRSKLPVSTARKSPLPKHD